MGVGSHQALEGRGRLAGLRKGTGHHHLLNQSEVENWFSFCYLDSSKVPGMRLPGNEYLERKQPREIKTEPGSHQQALTVSEVCAM